MKSKFIGIHESKDVVYRQMPSTLIFTNLAPYGSQNCFCDSSNQVFPTTIGSIKLKQNFTVTATIFEGANIYHESFIML